MQDDRRGFLKTLLTTIAMPAVDLGAKCVADSSKENVFARWACDLSGWRWPKEWGEPPERFRHKLNDLQGRARYECCKEEYHEIFEVMVKLAGGHKEYLRHWNVTERRKNPHDAGMTNNEFEKWYESGRPVRGLE